ncbi:hypothetical protein BDV12DRAFT_56081 [Aspergillus spectabilis]
MTNLSSCTVISLQEPSNRSCKRWYLPSWIRTCGYMYIPSTPQLLDASSSLTRRSGSPAW